MIGFDADHCIVKYNIRALVALLTDITKKDLFNLGYPEEIKQVPEALYGISLNNAIWDIEHRTILKLGEGKLVVRATKGSRPMT